LELDGLHGVAGISLGGMQAFEWATTYPDFVARAVPVLASPRMTAYDLLSWALFETIVEGCGPKCEDHTRQMAHTFLTVSGLRTPEYWNRNLSREDVPGFLDRIQDQAQYLPDKYDMLTHLGAISMMDVSEPFGGSLERAANAVQAERFIVVNDPDLLVTPEPSRRFAEMSGGRLLETDSDCGHVAFLNDCAGEEITAAIREFLW